MSKHLNNFTNELIDGFRAGDEQCFTEVFNLYFHALCFYALKITNDQAAAEDITEESFVKIWERKGMFTEIKVLKSYLYRTVRNGSLDWLRKRKSTHSISENIDNTISMAENNSCRNIIEAEVWDKLAIALEKLPQRSRQIINMIFVEGKKTKEVAKKLGIAQSTVKTLKGRSILKLKKSFNL